MLHCASKLCIQCAAPWQVIKANQLSVAKTQTQLETMDGCQANRRNRAVAAEEQQQDLLGNLANWGVKCRKPKPNGSVDAPKESS